MTEYDEKIPWPENMPLVVAKSAKRIDLYRNNPKIVSFYILERENMEVYVKTAEECGEISGRDAYQILKKIGLRS